MSNEIKLTERTSGTEFTVDISIIKSVYPVADFCKVIFYVPPDGSTETVYFVKESVTEIFAKIKEVQHD